MRKLTALIFVATMSVFSCDRGGPSDQPEKLHLLATRQQGKDPCALLGQDPGCDVCDELGFYGDGVCDLGLVRYGVCLEDDPDCLDFETDCANGLDDDGNGLADCQDPVCADTPHCWDSPLCGNGIREGADEECDTDDLGGETCETLGYDGGTLLCAPDCTFDTSQCLPVLPGSEICDNQIDDDGDGLVDCDDPDCFDPTFCQVAVCGDGILEAPEECDTDDLGGETCETLGYDGGTLLCAPDCTFDTSQCLPVLPGSEICDNQIDDDGDGLVDCDDPDCFDVTFCGLEEVCDNRIDDDGDGLVDCDDPDCLQVPGACPICGNGIREGGEECDLRDLGGETCETLGYDGGTLLCAPDCTFDTSQCFDN